MTEFTPETNTPLVGGMSPDKPADPAAMARRSGSLIDADLLSQDRVDLIITIIEEGFRSTAGETEVTYREGVDGVPEEVLTIRDQVAQVSDSDEELSPAQVAGFRRLRRGELGESGTDRIDPRNSHSALGATATAVSARLNGIDVFDRFGDGNNGDHDNSLPTDTDNDGVALTPTEIATGTVIIPEPYGNEEIERALKAAKALPNLSPRSSAATQEVTNRRTRTLNWLQQGVSNIRTRVQESLHKIERKQVRRAAIFAGSVAMSIVAITGATSFSTNTEQKALTTNAPAVETIYDQSTPSTIVDNQGTVLTIEQRYEQLSPEQQIAFDGMTAWINANPDKDFNEEFQKAAALGYFNS